MTTLMFGAVMVVGIVRVLTLGGNVAVCTRWYAELLVRTMTACALTLTASTEVCDELAFVHRKLRPRNAWCNAAVNEPPCRFADPPVRPGYVLSVRS
jgi:hypothetical protein